MKLIIVTPKRKVLEVETTEVIVPGALGYMGFLEGHQSLVSSLGIGVVEYRSERTVERLIVVRGYVEVRDNVVTVLADNIELPTEIDVSAIRGQLEEAEKRLSTGEGDQEHASRSLELARARQELAKH